MSNPVCEGVNTSQSIGEIISLTGHQLGNVNGAGSKLITPVTQKR